MLEAPKITVPHLYLIYRLLQYNCAINSGGMRNWIFLSERPLIQIDYGLHLANRVMALFLIKDKKLDYNIVNA